MDHDPTDRPGLEQAELREASREGPHGSHNDAHTGPVEEHDARKHAHEAADHGPVSNHGVDHEAMGHSAPASGAVNHAEMDHSTMDHGGGGSHHDHHAMMVEDFKRRFWVCLGLTVPILALSPMLQMWAGVEWTFPGSVWVLTGLAAVVYLYGGTPFLTGARDELAKRRPGMMTLVALAITVAFVYSVAVVLGLEGNLFFWETATLVDLMLVGHWVEMRSVMGASRALEELARLMPDEAHRLTTSGETEDVPTSALRPGDRILVKASEKVPADGTVLDGRSAVNQAALTGESVPVEKGEGDELIAGSVNGSGALTVEVTKTGADAYLNQVVTLVREAQASKSRTQDLANRAAFYLTVTAITVGALTFLAWWLLTVEPLSFAIERAVTVMVIACPHALGLAVPLVVAVSTSISARNGLLIRDRAAFERARDLDTLVFDKTGTLTEGRFGVTEILPAGGVAEDDLLALAAAVEGGSEHPIAAGVVRSAQDRGLGLPVRLRLRGHHGPRRPGHCRRPDRPDPEPRGRRGRGRPLRRRAPPAGRRARDGGPDRRLRGRRRGAEARPLGALALADVVRPESKEAIARLHELGIAAVMLTGDKREVADHVARQLGIDRVIAEVLPDGKSAEIKKLQAEGHVVAMTGDGVNDAPALATADIVLASARARTWPSRRPTSSSRTLAAVRVIALARTTYRKMVQNLWWAAGYNIVAIPLAAGVLAPWGVVLSPAVGAVLMSLSTVVVAVNARRLTVD